MCRAQGAANGEGLGKSLVAREALAHYQRLDLSG